MSGCGASWLMGGSDDVRLRAGSPAFKPKADEIPEISLLFYYILFSLLIALINALN
jgi:hypothetical protein